MLTARGCWTSRNSSRGSRRRGSGWPNWRRSRQRIGEAAQEAELRLVIGQLEEFARRVSKELQEPDWETRREIVRALVKKVEIDEQEVRIVYRVSPSPFEGGPQQGRSQHCWGRAQPPAFEMFLHYVLDQWFEKEVRPRLKGEAFLIRYADDFVIGVAREDDARRIMDVLPKRMSKYGLTVHPEKTRLIRFHPDGPARLRNRRQGTPRSPRTFDFLGFTHYWGRVAKRRMGGQAKDGEEPTQASACKRCRSGAGRIGINRSRTNTKSSSRSCKATTGTTGSWATSPASRSSGRKRGRSGDDGCRGDAATVTCRGQISAPGAAIRSSPCPCGPQPARPRSES